MKKELIQDLIPVKRRKMIKFIDLFCGLGSFRLGMEKQGFKCVFSSDINKHAREIYNENFGDIPNDDITKIEAEDIPEFDILCGGFPCQSFSLAGKQKGFNDTRGTLFFEILRITKYHKPKVLLLENVKNLLNHDRGKTFKIIVSSLESIGYTVSYKVLNGNDFGVAQNRERLIIVACLDNILFNFKYIQYQKQITIQDILEESEKYEYLDPSTYTLLKDPKKQKKSGLYVVGYLNKPLRDKKGNVNSAGTHRQYNVIYSVQGTLATLCTSHISSLILTKDNRVRNLTMIELFRLMGFSDSYKKIGAKTNLVARVGNSVIVQLITEVARNINNQVFKGINQYKTLL
jgi:DNA (cytosine-5)-methyltransferase 1